MKYTGPHKPLQKFQSFLFLTENHNETKLSLIRPVTVKVNAYTMQIIVKKTMQIIVKITGYFLEH